MRTALLVCTPVLLLTAALFPSCDRCGEGAPEQPAAADASSSLDPREVHLRNLRQLTFGDENAEAYFSGDGARLVFQSTHGGLCCDQIFVMNLDGSGKKMVSTGLGRTTCAYFLPGDRRILYSSTHLKDAKCPPRPDYSQGYVWPLYDGYDIFTANADGSDLRRLTDTPGYDAEATVSPDGAKIVFTSLRDGDIEIYTMDVDGRGVCRLTHEKGYDGGAFFSPDSKRICYRAHHPRTPQEVAQYDVLLKQGLIRPSVLEIWVMDAGGGQKQQVTQNGAANFCPFFTPDGEHIIFSSNLERQGSREFELYVIGCDGAGLERVTFSPEFDGFPMFSPDGSKLVFASNRGGSVKGETNIFLADWQ
ncbi:MAG: PD40 domain-containing protein [Planctomycetes bacterium]|nr:PD40 domain-containing protein [Planctomycetota bacterium]